MTSTRDRLQIAARIHFLLLREIGQGIDIEQMLKQPRYERDVLLVCDACRDTELARLAQQYRSAGPAPAANAGTGSGGHAPRPTEWARSTSGFGVSRPPDPGTAAAAAKPKVRDTIAKWLKR